MTHRPYEALTPEQMAEWDRRMRRYEELREGTDDSSTEDEATDANQQEDDES
jgi:hypothetical protein